MSNLLNLRNLREFNPQRAAGTVKRETAKREAIKRYEVTNQPIKY